MGMAGEGLGFCATGFGRKKEFAVKKSRFGVKLNSKKMEDGLAVSHSTRSQLQRRCVFLDGYSVINEHQWEDEATDWFWNYHCQNQGGMCYRHKLTGLINRVNLWAESKMGLKQKIEEGL